MWCPRSDVFETRSVVLAPIFVSKVLCSNFDATGTYFVTGCSDNVARVWAVSSAHSTGTAPLVFLAQFRVSSSACRLTVVNVSRSATPEPYWTLEGHTDSVHCALFSNNSDRILTGYTDRATPS